jgi:hypothetical protein
MPRPAHKPLTEKAIKAVVPGTMPIDLRDARR